MSSTNLMTSKNKILLLVFAVIVFQIKFLSAQDTFSIIAADSATGEIGSAGASCIDASFFAPKGAHIISEIIPGRGGAHCQASLVLANKTTVKNRLAAGDAPWEVIQYVTQNDINSDSTIRQYGVVDFDSNGSVRVAAFTGDSCMDYKNHIIGPNYAIQGNILLGQAILDSMEAGFLNTPGTLAEKLMAALQGANVPGADTRCMSEGRSSQSAFIRIAKPGDDPLHLFMDLAVYNIFSNGEPIDALQTQFDNFVPDTTSNTGFMLTSNTEEIKILQSNGRISLEYPVGKRDLVEVYDATGKKVLTSRSTSFDFKGAPGYYTIRILLDEVNPYLSKTFYFTAQP